MGGYDKQRGRVERKKKKSDETKKMKTVREITGKPGRMSTGSGEQRERAREREKRRRR